MVYLETVLKPNKNRERFWEVFTKYLQRYIPEDSSIIDIGAGRCEFINNIKAKDKWALDIEGGLSAFANEDVKIFIDKYEHVSFQSDIVFMSNVIEHLDSDKIKSILDSIHFKLRDKLIIFSPNYRYCYKRYWDDPTHKTALSHITLKRILEINGFKIKGIHPRIAPYSVEGSDFPIPKFIIWLYLHSPIRPFAGQMLVVAEKNNGQL